MKVKLKVVRDGAVLIRIHGLATNGKTAKAAIAAGENANMQRNEGRGEH